MEIYIPSFGILAESLEDDDRVNILHYKKLADLDPNIQSRRVIHSIIKNIEDRNNFVTIIKTDVNGSSHQIKMYKATEKEYDALKNYSKYGNKPPYSTRH